MSHILITAVNYSAPALDTSSISVAQDDDILASYETCEYFCANGHDFTLSFTDDVKPPLYFECPTCTALAVNEPFKGKNGERETFDSVLEEASAVSKPSLIFQPGASPVLVMSR